MQKVRLGILSDSHGRVEPTRAAHHLLRERGCSVFIHLGDLGSEAVVDELVGLNARIVLGNCDEAELGRYAELVGVINDHPAGRVTIDGRVIAFTHGHLEHELQAAFVEGVAYLLHGHSHEIRDERIGQTRVINPGALHRAARYTAAVLEPAIDRLDFVELPRR